MSYIEEALTFNCRGDSLVGVLATPRRSSGCTGVVLVVGGPQYRVGSHRQFVGVSRALASAGVPCLRFDYRGMGDSEGEQRDFADIDDDLAAAVDTFIHHCPKVSQIVLWGLCDGATAAAFYAPDDARVKGLVMLNPWVHTEAGEAQVYLKHYYLKRVLSSSFWRKIFAGDFELRRAMTGAFTLFRKAFLKDGALRNEARRMEAPLPQRFAESLKFRTLKKLIILSEQDYVAREFQTLVDRDSDWQRIVADATIKTIPAADHTFSDPGASAEVEALTATWVRAMETGNSETVSNK